MGAHVIAIKDMAGLCQPRAAFDLVKALKEEIGLPMHFHTHDTSGIGAASVLAAVAAGADAVDAAIDAMSGLTSQPNLGSIVEALRFGDRDSQLDPNRLRLISAYWEQVRRGYVAFESDIRSGASEVYVHGMPGGQYTNLKEQARSLGIEDHRWSEVAGAYSQVNEMFGDIIKVTPTSKVVGDMALMMVTAGLTREAVLDPGSDVTFPESVVQLFRGELGQPTGGFPRELQSKVLAGRAALTARPGALMPAVDLAAERVAAEKKIGRTVTDPELASISCIRRYSQTTRPSGRLRRRRHLADGRVLLRHGAGPGDQHRSRARQDPHRALRHHERCARGRYAHGVLRAQRPAAPASRAGSQPGGEAAAARKAEPGNVKHVGAPMPGTIGTVAVRARQKVARGDVLLTLEAMKMETTVRSEQDGTIKEVLATPGMAVDAKDLLVVFD